MEQKKIDRINFLARKSKTDGLTAEEKAEQAQLRSEYINAFRTNLIAQLDNVYLVDENGKKHKAKRKKNDTTNNN